MGSIDKIYDSSIINPINYDNNDISNDSVLKHLSVSDFLKANNKFEPIKNRGSFDNTISKDPLFLSAKDFQNNLFLTEILGLNTYITNIESQKDIDNFENLLKKYNYNISTRNNNYNIGTYNINSLQDQTVISYNSLSLFKRIEITKVILEKYNLSVIINNKLYIHTLNLLNFINDYQYSVDLNTLLKNEHEKTRKHKLKYRISLDILVANIYYIPFSILSTEFLEQLSIFIPNVYFNNKVIKKDYTPLKTQKLFDITENFDKLFDPKEFFARTFSNFVKTKTNSIFCGEGFGSNLRNLIQRKATTVTLKLIKEEFKYFLSYFNTIYSSNYYLVDLYFEDAGNKRLKVVIIVSIDDTEYQLDIQGPLISNETIYLNK